MQGSVTPHSSVASESRQPVGPVAPEGATGSAMARMREQAGRLRARPWVGDLQLLPALAVLFVVLALTTDGFLSSTNLTNILSQSAIAGIASIGATFVILTGGIDLSVGSTIGASGVVAAAIMAKSGSVVEGVVLGVLTGMVVGAILGGLIVRFGLVPFVVTLAGLFMVSGVTTLASDGKTLGGLPTSFGDIGFNTFLGLPIPVVIAIVLYVSGQWALTRTRWGRKVLLVGANPMAASVSGIGVRRVVWSTYVVSGTFAGIAGVLLTATLLGANSTMASGQLLTVIGTVVIGGTSLFGGKGSVLRTALGVLFLGMLVNGLSILGLESYDQQTITGVVILAAAGLDVALNRKPR